MSGAYEFGRATPGDRDALVDVQRHHLGGDVERRRRYLAWKYDENPYLDEAVIYVARHEGRVVGMRGLFGSRWEVGTPSAPVTLACAGDLVIEPDHRGRGAFAGVNRAALADAAARAGGFVLNLSASPVTLAGGLALGWRGIGPLGKVERHGPWSGRWVRFPLAPGGNGGRISSAETARPWDMAELVARCGHDGRIRHVRDGEYFAWRFRNPLCRYEFLFAGDASLEGYLVLQHPAQGDGPHVIVDWEAASDDVRGQLLAAALRRQGRDRRGVIAWSAAVPYGGARLLAASGFAPVEEPGPVGRMRPTVMVRDLAPDPTWELAGTPVLEQRNWDLRPLYSDAF